jgi:hypothetical protein
MAAPPPPPPSASAHYAWNAATAQRNAELAALNVSTAPRLVSSTADVASPTSPGASAWNSAGTWEERDVTSAATVALRAALVALRPPAQRGLELRVTAAECPTAEVRVIATRGVRRVGFELALKLSWELVGADGARAAAGTATVDEAADTDADVFDNLKVTVGAGATIATGEAVAIVKLADGAIRAAFKAWTAGLVA